MARTKRKAHSNRGNIKRRRAEDRPSQGKRPSRVTHDSQHTPDRPFKKARLTKSPPNVDSTSHEPQSIPPASPLRGTPSQNEVRDRSINIPAISNELAATHEVTAMSVISSSQIQRKVTRVLETLATFSFVPPAKPKVVILYSKAPVASKMISIVEIAKREISKDGGKWFQYSKVNESLEEKKKARKNLGGKDTKRKANEEDDSMDLGEDGIVESEEEAPAFETMMTPFERAIEGRPKLRAVPIMTSFLSRVRIESLKKTYGEQTNSLEKTKS